MRILQISAYFYPSYRGTEQFIANLSEALERRGHQVNILCVNTEGTDVKQEILGKNIHVYRCAPTWRYQRAVFSLEFTIKMLSARKYDLYHMHIPFQTGLETVLVASFLNRTPMVANHHGEGPELGWMHGFLMNSYNLFYRNLVLPWMKRIIFFTHSYPESLGLSLRTKERVRVIRPAIDTCRFSPSQDGAHLKRHYGWHEGDKVVLLVSGLNLGDRGRGADRLIRAMVGVRNEVENSRLLIVGEGPLMPELRRLTIDLGVESYVQLAGKVVGQDLAQHYAMCDIFVLPSNYESFGYSVMEAKASGKPVIASNIPGLGEQVRHGETGLSVPKGDTQALTQAIIQLLKDDALRYRMGKKGREDIMNHTWDQVAEEIETVYHEALGK